MTFPVAYAKFASCQHCDKPLRRLENGHWVDAKGGYNCAKDLRHEPMPAGLEGAPR